MDQTSEPEELNLLNDIEAKFKSIEKIKEELGKAKEELENALTGNKTWLFSAAKYGKLDILKNLISRGAEVNSLDDHQNLAVDYAWTNKHYHVVLVLLQADSKFPKQFNLIQLYESAHDLKNFVEERNYLHQFIQDDNLTEIQKLVNKNESKFYFNEENESAASAAFKSKRKEIYAYLKTIGAEIFLECETEDIEKLSFEHKVALKDAMLPHFPTVPEGHILYLISKSRSQKPVEGLKDKLHHFYSTLDEIPEVSTILKVIQHSDYLDIVFDFDEENVAKVNPTAYKMTKGETNYEEGRLFIAASPKRGERKILGTIAHEITHMAMQLLFENECNPYVAIDKDGEQNFEKITKKILNGVIYTANNNPSQILFNVRKEYFKQDYHCELIVTVPQILAEYEYDEYGKHWLQENASELFNFYTEVIVPKCQVFVDESFFLKPKSAVKRLNETFGQTTKLNSSNIIFENDDENVMDLLQNRESKILILRTSNTFLGMIKILQGTFGENYVHLYDKYLAFDVDNLMSRLKEIMQTFYLDACDTLVVRCDADSYQEGLMKQFLNALCEMFQLKPDKKLIFVVNPDVEETLFRILRKENLWNLCAEKSDENTSLNDLNKASRKKILSKKVRFQGEKNILKELIGEDEEMNQLITGDIIESLIEGKDINFGGITSDYSHIESCFGYIYEEINLETFICEFKNQNDIFVIKGLEGPNKKEQLIACFDEYINRGLIDYETIASEIQNITFENFENVTRKLILTDGFSDEIIKKFCQHNPKTKIYFIEVENRSKFILHQFYNPNFYMERKLKMVFLLKVDLETLMSVYKNETFIISKKNNVNDFKLEKKYDNVQLLNVEEAQILFNDFIVNEKFGHWFHVNDFNKIYWINSLPAMGTWKDFNGRLSKNKCLIKEDDMIENLMIKKVLVIANNPGMGKSTTLTKLYENKSISRTHWIIRINLKEHVKVIKSTDYRDFNIQRLIELLQKMKSNLQNKLAKNLLDSALNPDKKFRKCLLLAFDGFDEILDETDRENIIFLLQYLQKKTKSKVWVTTRLHFKELLESKLTTFAAELEPLDVEQQKLFIKKYLEDRLKLVLNPELTYEIFDDNIKENSTMRIYIQKFLRYMKMISDDFSVFIRTPLQLKLLIENSVEHFQTWIKNQGNLDFSNLGQNVLEIYEKFIDRKYEVYFKKQNILEEFTKQKEKKLFEQYHKVLAESQTRNINLEKKVKNPDVSILLIGLLQSNDGINVQFVHFTFREYFSAMAFTDYITKDSKGSFDLEKKMKYFIKQILSNPGFLLIRNFMNAKLQKCDLKMIPKNTLMTFRKIIISPWYKNRLLRPKFNLKTEEIFSKVTEEGNETLLSFIFLSCEALFNKRLNFEFLTTKDDRERTLLHSAIFSGNLQIVDTIWKKMERVALEKQREIILKEYSNNNVVFFDGSRKCHSILHFAVLTGNFQIVTLVFEKVKELLRPDELRSLLMEDVNKNVLHIASELGSTKIVKVLLQKESEILSLSEQKKIITMTNYTFETALHRIAQLGHTEILKIFLGKIKEISSDEDRKQIITMRDHRLHTFLHVAVKYEKTEIVIMILETITNMLSSEEQGNFIKMTGEYSNTLLHLAAKNGNSQIMNILLDKIRKILPPKEQKNILTMTQSTNHTILHQSAINGNSKMLKILLNKSAEILSWEERKNFITLTDKNSETILHQSVNYRGAETFETLLEGLKRWSLEEQKQFMTKTNKFGQTVLHIAAAWGLTEILQIFIEKVAEILSGEERKQIITMRDHRLHTFLHVAVEKGKTKIVIIILETVKNMLSSEEQAEFIKMTGESSNTVFHLAAENGDTEIMNILLDKIKEILPHKEKNILTMTQSAKHTILHKSAMNGNSKMFKILLEKSAEILSWEERKNFITMTDENSETILHKSVHKYGVETFKILLEEGLEMLPLDDQKKFMTKTDKFGQTVLHTATDKGIAEIVMLLLDKKGIKRFSVEEQNKFITATNNKSETAAHISERGPSSAQILKIFRKKGIICYRP